MPEKKSGERGPTRDEVKLAIKTLSNTRFVGPNNINAELIKAEEPELADKLHKVMIKAWKTGKNSP
jgi:hypothetical protein